MDEAVAVLDVGKTHTKLTLITLDRGVVASRGRANVPKIERGARFLDAEGIEAWVKTNLRELVREANVVAIVPVAHGAAAALVRDDRLLLPVLDYEAEVPAAISHAYGGLRDPFARTLSPRLPNGLNLGQQLFWQEEVHSDARSPDTRILLWPQYWAWRLSGVAASEVTSLGCHSDLWFPYEGEFSVLARVRGWDRRLPPLRRANAVLDDIRDDLAAAVGLPPHCKIICGLHDSNASLVAARGMPALAGSAFAVVSTGTWFVALQSGRSAPLKLDPERDTLANVDVSGTPTPSARFMGGREYELMLGDALGRKPGPDDAVRAVARNLIALPSFVSGSGPFPERQGEIGDGIGTDGERAAVASLYLALMTNVCLDLIDAKGPLLIEGRFAADAVFPSALASLRRKQPVLAWTGSDGIALGAGRLVWPQLPVPGARAVAPLPFDLGRYAEAWSRATANAPKSRDG